MLRFFVGQNLPVADNSQSLIAEKRAAARSSDHTHINNEGGEVKTNCCCRPEILKDCMNRADLRKTMGSGAVPVRICSHALYAVT